MSYIVNFQSYPGDEEFIQFTWGPFERWQDAHDFKKKVMDSGKYPENVFNNVFCLNDPKLIQLPGGRKDVIQGSTEEKS